MKKLTGICDMDSILVYLMGPWLSKYNARFGKNVTIEDVTFWDFLSTDEFGKIIEEPGFFRHLPPLPGALEGLKLLMDHGHEMFLVSAAGTTAASDKIAWMRQYAPFMRRRMFLTESRTPKEIIPADFIIDDAPHNLLAYQERHPNALLLTIDWPYNGDDQPEMAKLNPDRFKRCGSYKNTLKAWINIVSTVNEEACMWPH